MLTLFRPLIFAALSLALASCTVNPVTGKSELSLVSAQQEVAIGAENFRPSQQAQGGRYSIDPGLQLYVSDIGKKLAAVSDRPDLPYEFVVLNNSVPNAWALPGGKIAVNRGLLLHLEDEAQLAAVLAHEIVHAAARHSASRMTTGTLMNIGVAALGMASQSYGLGQAGSSFARLGASAWMAKYSRDDELESDAYGMNYMVRAGYDPYAAVRLQETFVKLSQDRNQDFISGLFASHPPSQARVTANLARAKTLPKGQNFRERYQRAIAQLQRDKPAYEAESRAIEALNEKDPAKALAELDKAIKVQPDESYFWELRGHAWKMQKNYSNAEKSFATAIRKNPDLFSPHLARGLLRFQQGNKAGARADLENSFQRLPTPVGSFFLGEIAAAAGEKPAAVRYYQQAANGQGEIGQRARERLSTLELATSPAKYILSQAYVGNGGYLYIAIKNNSAVAVSDIRVELTEMVSAFQSGPVRTLDVNGSLAPGQQLSISTGIGPFKTEEAAGKFRTRVTSARPGN